MMGRVNEQGMVWGGVRQERAESRVTRKELLGQLRGYVKIIKDNGAWKHRNPVGTRELIMKRKRDLMELNNKKYGRVVKKLAQVEIVKIEIEMKIENELEEMKWNIELNVKEKRERKSVAILQILPLMTTLEESWSRLQSGVDQWMETDRDKVTVYIRKIQKIIDAI